MVIKQWEYKGVPYRLLQQDKEFMVEVYSELVEVYSESYSGWIPAGSLFTGKMSLWQESLCWALKQEVRDRKIQRAKCVIMGVEGG